MKTAYTKKQILEALSYWNRLLESDEDGSMGPHMYAVATENGWIGKRTTKSGRPYVVAADAENQIWITSSRKEAEEMAKRCESMHLYNRFSPGTGVVEV